jgi:hypothetical protein
MQDNLFHIANTIALVGWLLLLFLPRWEHTFTVATFFCVLLLAALYCVLIVSGLSNFDPQSFSTLQNVMDLFRNKDAVLAGWVHYLAFDLLVGIHILKKTQTLKLPHALNFLLLPATFMFGPLGYMLFSIVRFIRTRAL